MVAGDHVPLTPLGDVGCNKGAVDPAQILGIGAKLGVMVVVHSAEQVIVSVLSPHNPTQVRVKTTVCPGVNPLTV